MLRQIIHRPIAVTMIVIAVAVIGVLSALHMPVSLMPAIDVPLITIHTQMPGASVREVEDKVTAVLRGQLMQVAGAQEVSSESRADASLITLTFTSGANMDLLFIEVNEKIDRAMSAMPRDVERPKVVKASAVDLPAFYLDVYSKADAQGMGLNELSGFVRGIVVKRLEQLPQTAMVDMSGTTGTEIVCTPRHESMDALGVRPEQIEQAIAQGNITLEALSVRDGLLRYNLHFDAQILTIDDIRSLPLNIEGRLLTLADLCDITERPQTDRARVRHDGREAVTMAVIKQSDARMDDLQASVDALLDDLRSEYPEVSFDITRDQTQLLSFSLRNLWQNLALGIALACAVLFLFMRSKRLPLLIVISIPLSLILTLLAFRVLGISINVISLSGLILGVGMIIDNSIIVIDNIMQRRTAGCEWAEAVVSGTRQVFTPMLSSVLTTCSVFVPLIFLSGTAGALFYDQAMGVSVALVASLVVAAVVVPVYLYTLTPTLSLKGEGAEKLPLMQVYERVLRFTLRHTKWCCVGFIVCVAFVAVIFGAMKKERMPEVPYSDALVEIDWNRGITAEENERRVMALTEHLADKVTTTTAMAGAQDFLLTHTRDITASEAVLYLQAASSEALDSVRSSAEAFISKRWPEASVAFKTSGNIYDLIFQTDEHDLCIRLQTESGTMPALADVRELRRELLAAFPGLNIAPVVAENTLVYRADLERMALYGVTYQSLYSRLRSIVGREKIFTIADGAQNTPVLLGVDTPQRDAILASTVRSNDGTDVPLSLLVSQTQGEDYKRLHASNIGQFYPLYIDADDAIIESVMDWLSNYSLPSGRVGVGAFTGSYFTSRQMIGELSIVLLVALALLYFILAAQFESLVQPLIILSEMVIDVAVVFLVLWLMGESLNIMSMTGLVVMAGIVINDSILKIDTINRLRRQGQSTLRAILTAGHQRLKPIVMTSLTTILAILPLLSRSDMGSAMQYPLSLTIVVGMTVGTLVSLFFVPMIYKTIYKQNNDMAVS